MNKILEIKELFTNYLKDLNLNLNTTNYVDNFIKDLNNTIALYQNDANDCNLNFHYTNTNLAGDIGYMGVEGAFAYEASNILFPKGKLKSYPDFKAVFEALKNDEITYGVLPLENTKTGSINDNYDLIREYGFYIVKDLNLKVSQNLLGIKGAKLSDINLVYSHEQGILQSKDFLEKHHIKYKYYNNTATAAKLVKELNDIHIGSISSKACSNIYDLAIIASDINQNETNTTRFIVICKDFIVLDNAKQISIIFNLKHESGSLFQILKDIKDYKLNMTRIESRPIKDKPFEYYFYLDFIGNIKDNNVIKALNKIKNDSINLRILGNY